MKPHETTIVSDYIWYSGRKVICNNFSRIIPFILFNLSPWALLSAGFLVESSKQSRWMPSKIWRWVGWAHTNREIQEDMYTILYMNTQYIYIYDYDDYDYIYSCPHRLFAHNYIATIRIVAFGSSKTSQILLFIGCRQLFKGSAPARPWWTLHRWCATQAEEEEAQEALRSRNLWGAPASIDIECASYVWKARHKGCDLSDSILRSHDSTRH